MTLPAPFGAARGTRPPQWAAEIHLCILFLSAASGMCGGMCRGHIDLVLSAAWGMCRAVGDLISARNLYVVLPVRCMRLSVLGTMSHLLQLDLGQFSDTKIQDNDTIKMTNLVSSHTHLAVTLISQQLCHAP